MSSAPHRTRRRCPRAVPDPRRAVQDSDLRTRRVGGAAGGRVSGAPPRRDLSGRPGTRPGPARAAASRDPTSHFAELPPCGSACAIGERGRDAAYSCPKCCGGTLCSPRRCPPGAAPGPGAGARHHWRPACPRKLNPVTVTAPLAPGEDPDPAPGRAWCRFPGGTQRNGDRATLAHARGSTHGAAGRYYNRRPPLLL